MNTNVIAFPDVAGRLGRIVNRYILKPLADWRARQAALDELMALDDHMLADIGISRGEIPGIVAGEVTPHRAVNENRPHAAA